MNTPNAIDVYVGSQVRHRRKTLGLSQTALAGKVGVTFQQLQKYEKGTNRIGASRLAAIARVLGIEVVSLFAGGPSPDGDHTVGPDPEQVALQSFMTSTDGLALNQAFFRIRDTRTRQRIVELVKSLARDPTAELQSDGPE